MSLIKRFPKWFQPDEINQVYSDELDEAELSAYYDYLRSRVRQPIQLWTIVDLANARYQYNIRLLTKEDYPLENLKVFDKDDNLLLDKNYEWYKKPTFDRIQISNNLSDKFYVEVTYHNFDNKVTLGFPQVANSTNEKYLPNSMLDDRAKELGMFRRTYRTDVENLDLNLTYPKGYPYTIEQDYWLEKRLLSEYITVDEVIKSHNLIDTNGNVLGTLEIKEPEVCRVSVITFDDVIDFIIENTDGTIDEEHYLGSSLQDLINQINTNSSVVKGTFLLEGGYLQSTMFKLQTQGRFAEYGALKAEIHEYLGVIPQIKDMSDSILIWNEREWNNYVWAGDDYDFAVFQVRIPYINIPDNFKYLTAEEIDLIAAKYRAFGTKNVNATYIYDTDLNLEMGIDDVEVDAGVDIDLELSINAGTADALIDLPEIEFNPLKVTGKVISNINLNPMDINIATQLYETIDALVLDQPQDFGVKTILRQNSAVNEKNLICEIGGDGDSSSFIEISQDSDSAMNAGTKCYNNTTMANHVIWSSGTYSSSGKNLFTGTANSNWLKVDNFGFSIPDDAIITGIYMDYAIKIPAAPNIVSTCIVSSKGTSDARVKSVTTANSWQYPTFGGPDDLWGLSGLTGVDINNSAFGLWIKVDGVPVNAIMYYQNAEITVFFRLKSGEFCSQKIKATTPIAGRTGRWGFLKQTLTEALPAGCSYKYDIFREYMDQSCSGNNASVGICRASNYLRHAQSFKPSVSTLSGIMLMTADKLGSPDIPLMISINQDAGGVPGMPIQSFQLPVEQVPDWSALYIPLDLVGLDTSKQYWIVLGNGTSSYYDENNYFKFQAILDTGSYANGQLKMWNGSSWVNYHGTNDDLAFATFYPSNLLVDQTDLNKNIRDLPYVDLKIRGKLVTADITKTPKIDTIEIIREEILQ